MGKVQRITDFGAFVEIIPGTDGLLHVSEIARHRVQDVRDELKEGEQVLVKVISIDPSGKIRLSRKALLAEEEGGGERREAARRGAAGSGRARAQAAPAAAGATAARADAAAAGRGGPGGARPPAGRPELARSERGRR